MKNAPGLRVDCSAIPEAFSLFCQTGYPRNARLPVGLYDWAAGANGAVTFCKNYTPAVIFGLEYLGIFL